MMTSTRKTSKAAAKTPAKIPARKPAKPKPPNAKEKGAPAAYLGDSGSFSPGMDARFKADLIYAVLGEDNPRALAEFKPAQAHRLLGRFAWLPHLEKAKASRETTRRKREAANAKERAGGEAET